MDAAVATKPMTRASCTAASCRDVMFDVCVPNSIPPCGGSAPITGTSVYRGSKWGRRGADLLSSGLSERPGLTTGALCPPPSPMSRFFNRRITAEIPPRIETFCRNMVRDTTRHNRNRARGGNRTPALDCR